MRSLKTLMALAIIFGTPARAAAQQGDGWDISLVPYVWPTSIDGDLSAGPVSVPIFLKFADVADDVAGAFSFHFEASRGRWGVLTDLSVIRLSSSATFAVLGRPIEGDFELDNITFELGGSYLVNQNARFGLIGGLRTYTLSPKVAFRAPTTEATPIDSTETSPNAFVGFIVRPRINDRWTFIGRADVGAGDADFTWSGVVGFEFRVASWGGLEFGYKGFGIDVKSDDRTVRAYDVTHYGPIVGFRFHWGR